MNESLVKSPSPATPRWFGPLTCGLTAVYLLSFVTSGWIPHDEGLMGQTAERALDGEIPHRDFHDMYSGGLTYLHAAAMSVGGIRLSVMRWMLFLGALVAVASWFAIASRFVRGWSAVGVVLACVAWSFPNYFAPLPTWYTLILASAGTWTLLRWSETHQGLWLVAAGLLGGLSLLVKIVALYYVCGALLWVGATRMFAGGGPHDQRTNSPGGLFWLFLVLAFLLVASLLLLIRSALAVTEVWVYVVPGAACALCLPTIACVRRLPIGVVGPLSKDVLLFLTGVAIPVVGAAGFLAANDGLADAVHGILVLPRQRFEDVAYALPGIVNLFLMLPLLAFFLAARTGLGRAETPTGIIVAVVLLTLAAVAGMPVGEGYKSTPMYSAIWMAYQLTPPALVLMAAWHTVTVARTTTVEPAAPPIAFLLGAMAGMLMLVQFPYSFGAYFCYAAPMVVLLGAAIIANQAYGQRPLSVMLLAFTVLFPVSWSNTGYIRDLGARYLPKPPTAPLELPRSGLEVPRDDAVLYSELYNVVTQHSAPGDFIYAAPDCPEVYFLCERRNPTHLIYDMFDSDPDRVTRILTSIEARAVRVVVINNFAEFSGPLESDIQEELKRRFPRQQQVGHFSVRWREN